MQDPTQPPQRCAHLPPQRRAAQNRTGAAQHAQGEEEETERRSEGTEQRSSCSAALPPRLCSSSRVTALATNSGSLAPTHDSSTPQEVAEMFHRQFSSTSHRTVIWPPPLLSSEVTIIDCLRIHLYIVIALSTGPPTHGREQPTHIYDLTECRSISRLSYFAFRFIVQLYRFALVRCHRLLPTLGTN